MLVGGTLARRGRDARADSGGWIREGFTRGAEFPLCVATSRPGGQGLRERVWGEVGNNNRHGPIVKYGCLLFRVATSRPGGQGLRERVWSEVGNNNRHGPIVKYGCLLFPERFCRPYRALELRLTLDPGLRSFLTCPGLCSPGPSGLQGPDP